jgi:hypothetical protein
MHAQTKSTATAFAIHPISSRRILTNAHAVANQIQVQLRKHGSARKFPARVVAVGHEVRQCYGAAQIAVYHCAVAAVACVLRSVLHAQE